MMAERGVQVAHTTILRWVIRYVPEYEKRWSRFARKVRTSYCARIAEIAAAKAFFRKALASVAPRGTAKRSHSMAMFPSKRALWLLRREHPCWRNVEVRTSRYLNNIIEQDHRAIKRRCASIAGFKSFANAAVTIAGIELAHRIRKRQFMLSRTYRRLGKWSLENEWAITLA